MIAMEKPQKQGVCMAAGAYWARKVGEEACNSLPIKIHT